MKHNTKEPHNGNIILVFFIMINVIVMREATINNERWYWLLLLTLPLLLLSALNIRRGKRTSFRNNAVIACLSYFFGWIRPGIRRYFVEPDPYNVDNNKLNHYKNKNHEKVN